MKFTPKEDIKAKGGRLFEADNTYDSHKHQLDDATIERWYSNGWTEIEGRDPAPERQVRGVIVRVNKATHSQKDSNDG